MEDVVLAEEQAGWKPYDADSVEEWGDDFPLKT